MPYINQAPAFSYIKSERRSFDGLRDDKNIYYIIAECVVDEMELMQKVSNEDNFFEFMLDSSSSI